MKVLTLIQIVLGGLSKTNHDIQTCVKMRHQKRIRIKLAIRYL